MTKLSIQMKAKLRHLLIDFEQAFSAEQISHRGERGRIFEECLRSFLQETMPERVGLTNAQIVGMIDDSPSRQVDIAIFDRTNFPSLIAAPSYRSLMIESVVSAIEVKSRLNKTTLRQAVANMDSVKSIRSFSERRQSILTVVFAYKTTWKNPENLLRLLAEAGNSNGLQLPDMICSLDPGFLLIATDSLGDAIERVGLIKAIAPDRPSKDKYPPGQYIFIRPLELPNEDILLWFYLMLMDHVNSSLEIGINMSGYIGGTSFGKTVIDLKNFTG